MIEALSAVRWRDIVDVALVAAIVYRVLTMFRGTRAVQMITGLGALLAVWVVARGLGLRALQWILDSLWSFWIITLVVLFQPELRRTLAWVGQGRALQRLFGASRAERARVVTEVAGATETLASRGIGALVVLERATGLRQYAELGVPLDAIVSADLLASIFMPASPLHDGAAFVQATRIVAAGCFLPLSRNLTVGRTLGTRHRAALGISEETDAVAIVVSEETTRVSIAVDGRLETMPDASTLERRLRELIGADEEPTAPAWLRRGLVRLRG